MKTKRYSLFNQSKGEVLDSIEAVDREEATELLMLRAGYYVMYDPVEENSDKE